MGEDVAETLERETVDNKNNDDECGLEEGETGTQDTAEATTEDEEEEEAEILGNEDNEEDPDGGEDDDVYESPMNRFESEAKAATSAASGEFSFKAAKENNSNVNRFWSVLVSLVLANLVGV
ncbi:unnamed protein product [Orchesella dallaii]